MLRTQHRRVAMALTPLTDQCMPGRRGVCTGFRGRACSRPRRRRSRRTDPWRGTSDIACGGGCAGRTRCIGGPRRGPRDGVAPRGARRSCRRRVRRGAASPPARRCRCRRSPWRRLPQVLLGVEQVDDLERVGKRHVGDVPDPGRAVADHDLAGLIEGTPTVSRGTPD